MSVPLGANADQRGAFGIPGAISCPDPAREVVEHPRRLSLSKPESSPREGSARNCAEGSRRRTIDAVSPCHLPVSPVPSLSREPIVLLRGSVERAGRVSRHPTSGRNMTGSGAAASLPRADSAPSPPHTCGMLLPHRCTRAAPSCLSYPWAAAALPVLRSLYDAQGRRARHLVHAQRWRLDRPLPSMPLRQLSTPSSCMTMAPRPCTAPPISTLRTGRYFGLGGAAIERKRSVHMDCSGRKIMGRRVAGRQHGLRQVTGVNVRRSAGKLARRGFLDLGRGSEVMASAQAATQRSTLAMDRGVQVPWLRPAALAPCPLTQLRST